MRSGLWIGMTGVLGVGLGLFVGSIHSASR